MPWIGRKDPEAFEVFYDRHGGAAFSLAYRILGERAAAEDCIQEAFISIWRSGARFDRTRGSVRSWTLSIVRNRAIDALRSKAGKAPKLTFDDDEILAARPAAERTEDQAIMHETATEVREMLEGVLGPEGTASEVSVPGYTLAGKTGTAEVAENGGYSKTKYIASFIGMAPAMNPKFLAAVIVDQPEGEIYGGSVAAPAFGEIAAFSLPYLGVPQE